MLFHCNIVNDSTLHLVDKRSLWIRVWVPNGLEVALSVPPSLGVAVFKQRVAYLTRTRADNLWLTLNAWLLQNSRVLSGYNIHDTATVQMHPRANRGRGQRAPMVDASAG